MKRAILMTSVLLFILSTVFAENKSHQNDVPSFTDQDLKKYGKPSDVKPLLEPNPERSPGYKGEGQELKRYEIPYEAYEGTARRIIIQVTFNDNVTAPMLFDTGAPGMHISHRLAEKLRIFDEDESKLLVWARGIGGKVPAIYTIIDKIQVGGAEDHFIPTTVTDSISPHFEGLIGMDFMANYSIQIDTKKHVMVFEELPPGPDIYGGHNEIWWRNTFHNLSFMRSAWEKYQEYLDNLNSDAKKLKELRKVVDQQYDSADRLYNKLWGYASEHAVPMEWREYSVNVTIREE